MAGRRRRGCPASGARAGLKAARVSTDGSRSSDAWIGQKTQGARAVMMMSLAGPPGSWAGLCAEPPGGSRPRAPASSNYTPETPGSTSCPGVLPNNTGVPIVFSARGRSCSRRVNRQGPAGPSTRRMLKANMTGVNHNVYGPTRRGTLRRKGDGQRRWLPRALGGNCVRTQAALTGLKRLTAALAPCRRLGLDTVGLLSNF